MNETDTRDFFETTNKDEKEPKYVFLKYTTSKDQAGEINAPRSNPAECESISEFKKRIKGSIAKEGKDNIAKKFW